jgi:hypothetical protein
MPKKRKPAWDLYRDGLSYSLICKFRNCRERFRISTVEGLRSTDRKAAMEFGTIFHKALEFAAHGKTSSQIITELFKFYKDTTVDHDLIRQACILVPHYNKYYESERKTYVAQEEVFDIPYKSCVTGKIVRLRGRRDEVYQVGKTLWLQENKTKTTIDETKILLTLPHDLQTMLYVYSMTHDYAGRRIGGVLYNVIRRPMLRQGQKESESQFYQRLNEHVSDDPSHYFKRYEVELVPSDIQRFFNETLVPIVENIVVWWESVKRNPFEPWMDEQGNPNPHHYRTPFGIFDPMTIGVGDYFDYVTSGSEIGLERVTTAFPELEGEQGQGKKKVKVDTAV